MERKFAKWTNAEILFLIENYDLLTRSELAENLNKTFMAVKSKARDLQLKKSAEAIKAISKRPNAGHFQKGSMPGNTLSDGAISTRVDTGGRIIKHIRVGLNKWMELQHYVWEQAGFEKTRGMVLAFKDGDTTNCNISNLELITKAQNLERNRPKGEKRLLLQPKIVASRKSPAQKIAIKKEIKVKRRAAKRIGQQKLKQIIKTNYQFLAAEKRARLKVEEQKKKSVEIIFSAEQKKMAQKQKERERINKEAEETKKLPNRVIDYSQLIAVRIDEKTVMYVKPGTDIEKLKAKYTKPLR